MHAPDARTGIIFGILLSGVMFFVFSGFMPLVALGPTVEWVQTWAVGFAIAWPTSFVLVAALRNPLMLLASRLAQRNWSNWRR